MGVGIASTVAVIGPGRARNSIGASHDEVQKLHNGSLAVLPALEGFLGPLSLGSASPPPHAAIRRVPAVAIANKAVLKFTRRLCFSRMLRINPLKRMSLRCYWN